ncbi:MAG: hypothetical protein WBV81_23245 [Ignavibacteriaceae bacterium]
MFKALKIVFILSLAFFSSSCFKDVADNPKGNQPPHTGVFLYPDSSISSQPSKINIHWWGDDPDGFVTGYYFTWNGKDWSFTKSNDSLFALKIGVVDTNYLFQVAAADNGGNGIYDKDIFQNGIDYGPEPFVDKNNNGAWDRGELFTDIGLIDPHPASVDFPIKNSAPVVQWDQLTVLPDTSFPAMSFGWDASDVDGDGTILKINIALNDTANPENIVSLDGSVRNISIITNDFSSSSPKMDILIGGLESNPAQQKLPGLIFNGNNKLYVQAEDISGAKSSFISIPGEGRTWFVKKPKGKLLIVDDYVTQDDAPSFYSKMFSDSLSLNDKYDVYDFHNQQPPYLNVTFLLTLKLFKYVYWYTDNNPSLDLLSASTQKFLDAGGKIAFSMQFPQAIDLTALQGFLPIRSDSSGSKTSLIGGTKILSDTTQLSYPDLQLSSSIFRVKSFYLNMLGAIPLYHVSDKDLKGFVGFISLDKTVFFMGIPLNKANGGNANVKKLLNQVFFQDFGLVQ